MTETSNPLMTSLEMRVKKILESEDRITVELGGLHKGSYDLLKELFEKNYEVMGIANILNDGKTTVDNYVLQIRKR